MTKVTIIVKGNADDAAKAMAARGITYGVRSIVPVMDKTYLQVVVTLDADSATVRKVQLWFLEPTVQHGFRRGTCLFYRNHDAER